MTLGRLILGTVGNVLKIIEAIWIGSVAAGKGRGTFQYGCHSDYYWENEAKLP